MSDKYAFPQLKAALQSQGIYLQEFYTAAHQVSNGRAPGNRTWSLAMNPERGVTETTANKMSDIAKKAIGHLGKNIADDVLNKAKVS